MTFPTKNLKIVIKDGKLFLTWNRPYVSGGQDTPEIPVEKYEVDFKKNITVAWLRTDKWWVNPNLPMHGIYPNNWEENYWKGPKLLAGTKYDVRVRTTLSNNSVSEYSNIATITIPVPVTAPGISVIPKLVANKDGTVLLGVTTKNNGGSPIIGYEVRFKNSASPSWIDFPLDGKITSPIRLVGFDNGVSYDFEIAATNKVGTGPYSALKSVKIPSNVIPPPPDEDVTGLYSKYFEVSVKVGTPEKNWKLLAAIDTKVVDLNSIQIKFIRTYQRMGKEVIALLAVGIKK